MTRGWEGKRMSRPVSLVEFVERFEPQMAGADGPDLEKQWHRSACPGLVKSVKTLGYTAEDARRCTLGQVDIDGADVLRGPGQSQSALATAEEFVRNALADGPQPSTELFTKAEAEGIKRRTLSRAL